MTIASLPLPVGARTAGPTSRSVAEAWAAPRAADLVLDPWAAPVGPPIARMLLSPWPAPDPALRLVSMPPPAALSSLPDLSVTSASAAASTDSALAALAAATPVAAPAGSSPVPPPAASVDVAPAEPVAARSTTRLRARMWAMIAGGAAATAGVATLIVTAF